MKLCLLDANVVIYLHKLGLWDMMTNRFDVYLSSVVCDESLFWVDDYGSKILIALDPSSFTSVSVDATETKKFEERFPTQKIDPGELESLAWLFSASCSDECQICSGDGVVYKILGALYESHRGVSLEELLITTGDKRKLEYAYTKKFRERKAEEGLAMGNKASSSPSSHPPQSKP